MQYLDEEVLYNTVNWNKRVIGRGSDYIELLKTKESEYLNNDKISRSDKRKKERQLLKSIHLMILEFIKIWQIDHDEILYVDYDESITNYMKQIHLCKVLQVDNHQIGRMKLKQFLLEQQQSDDIDDNDDYKAMHQQIKSQSTGIEITEIVASGKGHPVMTNDVIQIIHELMPEDKHSKNRVNNRNSMFFGWKYLRSKSQWKW